MILKHVRNRYYEITVTVSCKAHAQRPKAILYKVTALHNFIVCNLTYSKFTL